MTVTNGPHRAGNSEVEMAETTAPVGTRTARTAWSITILVTILQTVNFADKAVLGIVAQPMSEDLGLSHADIGLLGSVFYVLFVVTGLLGGFIADRVKIVWVLLAMALLWSLVQIPILLVGTFGALIISRVLLGAAEGPASSLTNVAVFGWFPKSKRGLPPRWSPPAPHCPRSSSPRPHPGGCRVRLEVGVLHPDDRRHRLGSRVAGGGQGRAVLGEPRPRVREGQWCGQDEAGEHPPDRGTAHLLGRCARHVRHLRHGLGDPHLAASYFEQGLGFSRVNSGLLFALPSVTGMASMLLGSFITDRLAGRGMTVRVSRGSCRPSRCSCAVSAWP